MTLNRLFRLSAMLLVAVLLTSNVAFAAKKPADPAVMKVRLQKRGVGQGVRVTLADNTDVRGLIVAIGDNSFTIKPKKKSADVQQIEYSQLTGVHNESLSRGQKTTLIVCLITAGIAITAIVAVHDFDTSFK